MVDYDKVLDLLRALERERVEYVLVGGVALNLLGITRATQDVDIVVRLDEQNIERLKNALRSVWNDPAIEEITFGDLAGDYPAIAYGPTDEAFGIDIVTRFGDMFPYEDLQAEIRPWEGVQVPVATPRTLYRMKKNTVRLIDRYDVAELQERFGIKDE